jgi:hypothetical protein
MSTRFNNGSHYENHPRAEELRHGAAHAHETGELHGMAEHPTDHEQSRHAQEHSPDADRFSSHGTTGHGVAAFGHDDIAARAHQHWLARGGPEGSPWQDWFRAVEELRSESKR